MRKKQQRLVRIIAIVLAVLLAGGAIISAVISIFVMPATLYLCEPVFAKTSRYWRHVKPQKAIGGGTPEGQTPVSTGKK